jgi:hypothetical protein
MRLPASGPGPGCELRHTYPTAARTRCRRGRRTTCQSQPPASRSPVPAPSAHTVTARGVTHLHVTDEGQRPANRVWRHAALDRGDGVPQRDEARRLNAASNALHGFVEPGQLQLAAAQARVVGDLVLGRRA